MPDKPDKTVEDGVAPHELAAIVGGVVRLRTFRQQDPAIIISRGQDGKLTALVLMDHSFGAGTKASDFEKFIDGLDSLNVEVEQLGYTRRYEGMWDKLDTLFEKVFPAGTGFQLIAVPDDSVSIVHVPTVERGATRRITGVPVIVEFENKNTLKLFTDYFTKSDPAKMNAFFSALFTPLREDPSAVDAVNATLSSARIEIPLDMAIKPQIQTVTREFLTAFQK